MISGFGSSEFQNPQGPNAIKHDISLLFFVDNSIQYYRSQANPMSKLKPSTQPKCPHLGCLLSKALVGVAHSAVDVSRECAVHS